MRHSFFSPSGFFKALGLFFVIFVCAALNTSGQTCAWIDFNQYYSSAQTDHLYLAEATPTFSGPGWVFVRREGSVYTCPDKNLVPLYRHWHPTLLDHFYTTTAGSVPGYNYEGIACYVYTASFGLTIPLYRYFSSTASDHFYTVTLGTYPGYTYETIACYIKP